MLEQLLIRVVNFQTFLVWDWIPIIKLMDTVILTVGWSLLVKCWESRSGSRRRLPWWGQHTTYLYFQFACILAAQIWTFRHEVCLHLTSTSTLLTRGCPVESGRNQNLKDFFHNATNASSRTTQECMQRIHNDPGSSEDFPRLVWFAFTTPLWVLGTFVLSGFMTYGHIREADRYSSSHCHNPSEGRNYTLWNRPHRHRTIWILQLPIVYSIAVLFAVQKALHRYRFAAAALIVSQHCPDLCRDEAGCWQSTKALQGFYFESALSFGDAYEGLALLLFASSTVDVIKARVEQLVDQADIARADARERVVKPRPSGRDARQRVVEPRPSGRLGEGGHSAQNNLMEIDEALAMTSEKLAMVTHDVATIGIKYFSFVCFAQAILPMISCQANTLAKTLTDWGWQSLAIHATNIHTVTMGYAESSKANVKGMGFLGSCVAIHNMILIEQSFHHDFLDNFRATPKFVSVKIMVSIVFFQEIFLPLLVGASQGGDAGLLDATLRSVEFFAISIFNIWAWKVKELWYSHFEMHRSWDLIKNVSFVKEKEVPLMSESSECNRPSCSGQEAEAVVARRQIAPAPVAGSSYGGLHCSSFV